MYSVDHSVRGNGGAEIEPGMYVNRNATWSAIELLGILILHMERLLNNTVVLRLAFFSRRILAAAVLGGCFLGFGAQTSILN